MHVPPSAQHTAPAHPPQAYAEFASSQPVDMNDRLAQLEQFG